MNRGEFRNWVRHTLSSKDRWTVDPIHNGGRGRLLVHFGGESGKYIHFNNGEVDLGTYEHAYPHIGDALFKPDWRQTFDSNKAAWAYMLLVEPRMAEIFATAEKARVRQFFA